VWRKYVENMENMDWAAIAERFWKKVKKGRQCWFWQGGIDSKGYAKIYLTIEPNVYKPVIAARVAWILKHGPIPEGRRVLHTCGEPKLCVNDAHLILSPIPVIQEPRPQQRTEKIRECQGCHGQFNARDMRTHPCVVGWTKRVPHHFDADTQTYRVLEAAAK
jgi:hypothetical protein